MPDQFTEQARADFQRARFKAFMNRMLEHIAVHRFFMGIDWKRDISEEEAIIHWYDNVYMPVINVIRDIDILKEFPTKTEGDLYLWVLDHQQYLVEEGKPLQPPEDAARTFLGNENKKTLRTKKKIKPKINIVNRRKK